MIGDGNDMEKNADFEKVIKAIVVIVSDGYSHSPTHISYPCLVGNI